MKTKLVPLLSKIVKNDILHAKWINTLSYLENCGARKIAACEHPIFVKEEVLKHASEEFRHSHYLKRQIKKLSTPFLSDYSIPFLLGGILSLQYLNRLDLFASHFLTKEIKFSKSKTKKLAYLLVTYAIELRAKELYPLYNDILRANNSKIFVKSIILEEEEHLKEMKEGLAKLSFGLKYAEKICNFEEDLFKKWIYTIETEL